MRFQARRLYRRDGCVVMVVTIVMRSEGQLWAEHVHVASGGAVPGAAGVFLCRLLPPRRRAQRRMGGDPGEIARR